MKTVLTSETTVIPVLFLITITCGTYIVDISEVIVVARVRPGGDPHILGSTF